jgi:hypothetical protein
LRGIKRRHTALWNTFAGGLLTGKKRRGEDVEREAYKVVVGM